MERYWLETGTKLHKTYESARNYGSDYSAPDGRHEVVFYADAQATIAALQAQLNEQSEKLKYHDLFKQWQCWRDPDELVDEYEKWQAAIQEHQALKDQLTQRTVERDTARRRVDELEAREVDVVTLREDLEQRTAEIEAANKLLYRKNCALGRAETIINDLQAELERVRGELATYKETKHDAI